jgi:hypothetical protein
MVMEGLLAIRVRFRTPSRERVVKGRVRRLDPSLPGTPLADARR